MIDHFGWALPNSTKRLIVKNGTTPRLELPLDTPRGEVELTS